MDEAYPHFHPFLLLFSLSLLELPCRVVVTERKSGECDWLSNNGPRWKIEEKRRILYTICERKKMNSKKERKKDVSSVHGLPESMVRWNADWNGMPTVLLLLLFPVSGVYSVYIFSSCIYTHTAYCSLFAHKMRIHKEPDWLLSALQQKKSGPVHSVCVHTVFSKTIPTGTWGPLKCLYSLLSLGPFFKCRYSNRTLAVRFPSPVKTLVMMGVATGGLR
jgi:hypothetical protein